MGLAPASHIPFLFTAFLGCPGVCHAVTTVRHTAQQDSRNNLTVGMPSRATAHARLPAASLADISRRGDFAQKRSNTSTVPELQSEQAWENNYLHDDNPSKDLISVSSQAADTMAQQQALQDELDKLEKTVQVVSEDREVKTKELQRLRAELAKAEMHKLEQVNSLRADVYELQLELVKADRIEAATKAELERVTTAAEKVQAQADALHEGKSVAVSTGALGTSKSSAGPRPRCPAAWAIASIGITATALLLGV